MKFFPTGKLEAEKTVLESLYTSPYQKWEKAKLALQAYKLSAKLPTNERPKELYAAILDASLNIGENSWTKTMLEGISIQHINYDPAKEKSHKCLLYLLDDLYTPGVSLTLYL